MEDMKAKVSVWSDGPDTFILGNVYLREMIVVYVCFTKFNVGLSIMSMSVYMCSHHYSHQYSF